MRALVISGGGSKGAFAGGVAEYLIKDCNRKYDLFIGSSTGSLLIPLLSIGEIEKLKNTFTSVQQNDVFSSSPFIIKQTPNGFKTKINHWGIIKMFLQGSKTFGTSDSLRDKIKSTFTEIDFNKVIKSSSEVFITVSNLSKKTVEYKSPKDCSYDDFCDWIWASANVVPFMSLIKKNGYDYADGGMGDVVPIYQAIQRGALEIDAIVLKTGKPIPDDSILPIHHALDLISRVFDFMLTQIMTDDVTLGMMEGAYKHVKINIYRPEEELTTNSLIFNPEVMKHWWKLGFETAAKLSRKEFIEEIRT